MLKYLTEKESNMLLQDNTFHPPTLFCSMKKIQQWL